jgi:GNAT superfamily N-acetyltransferase
VLGAQRACAAVFPKGVLAARPRRGRDPARSGTGAQLRAPGEDALDYPAMLNQFVTRPALDTDRDGLIKLIASAYAEYPGCVLEVEREEPDLLAIASAYARYGGAFSVMLEGQSGELVASAGWLPSPAPEYRGWLQLRKVYVASAYRRRGLARALLRGVESRARERGAAGIELWSDTRFLEAHRFYVRHGFQRGSATRELGDLRQSVEYHFEKRL